MSDKPVGTRLADLEARVAELERQLSDAVFHERVRETPIEAPRYAVPWPRITEYGSYTLDPETMVWKKAGT